MSILGSILCAICIYVAPTALNYIEKPIYGSVEEASDEWQTFTLTAYCGCEKCCGKNDRITATGTYAVEGVTIAVDPTIIPYGSMVDIEGIGTFVAEDCGGAIKGNRIDIYFENHADALTFGVWEEWRVRVRE